MKVKTWLQSTVKEDGLNDLALIAMNENKFNLDDAVLDNFTRKKNRRSNLILE